MPTFLEKLDRALGNRRVFLIHGWEGSPDVAWFPWLKKELESEGFEVHAPQMPNPDAPRVHVWVPLIKEQVGLLTKNDFFVGHSLGCLAILRYLIWEAEHENEEQAGGVVLVAPFVKLDKQEDKEDEEIAQEWTSPLNFDALNPFSASSDTRYVAIFSDNDPDVSLDNIPAFEDGLEADAITLEDMGHFSEADEMKELPIVLDELKKMA